MLRLALLSARGRLGTFTGALVALTASSALVMAGAMPLEAALRTHPPVERYAGSRGRGHRPAERGRRPRRAARRARPRELPRSRLGWRPCPVSAPRSATCRRRPGSAAGTRSAHGWGSAALTPYVLSAGRPPAGPDEVVTGYRAKLGARLRLASTEAARTVTVVGVARPRHPVRQRTAIFLTDAEAARLAGHPGRVDAIGVLAAPRLRRLAAERRRPRRGGAHRGRARQGRVSRPPGRRGPR